MAIRTQKVMQCARRPSGELASLVHASAMPVLSAAPTSPHASDLNTQLLLQRSRSDRRAHFLCSFGIAPIKESGNGLKASCTFVRSQHFEFAIPSMSVVRLALIYYKVCSYRSCTSTILRLNAARPVAPCCNSVRALRSRLPVACGVI